MGAEAIHKPALDQFSVQPIIGDYEETCKDFDWETAKDALDWFERDQSINIAHNCIDRHANGKLADKVGLHWIGGDGSEKIYTFKQLKEETNRCANLLKQIGIAKGDRVFLFLNRIPELYIGTMAILKVGAVAGPLFSAFGPDAIKDRLEDSGAVAIFTEASLKSRLEDVRSELPDLKHVILCGEHDAPDAAKGEVSYNEITAAASPEFEVERTSIDDYSIMHYTSGTTGKPKGAVHRHNSIISQKSTAQFALDLQDNDIYWCTADPGWVTGTSYGMIGPWSNGITQLVYAGGFDPDTWYGIIEKHQVTVWYTAPTAIRMLMKAGDEVPKKYDMTCLRHICSVGEPLNPEAIVWGKPIFNQAIHDNWWQTETGCIMIANYPPMEVRPGSMGRPIPGIQPGIIDDEGNEMPPGQEGNLAVRPGWPSMFQTYWNKQSMYDSRFQNGWYLTGDRAYKDEDGYYWFIGRSDDVINTAGHLVGPFEVESALVEHPAVAEAGVIGKPDKERMEIVKAFVALKDGHETSDELKEEIRLFVRNRLAAHAYPREIQFVDSLPKTRSGKIMRRLLKARDQGLPEGDTSTLEEF